MFFLKNLARKGLTYLKLSLLSVFNGLLLWHGFPVSHHSCCNKKQNYSVYVNVMCSEVVLLNMGQVTKLWLSCYLVLLSIDSKTR